MLNAFINGQKNLESRLFRESQQLTICLSRKASQGNGLTGMSDEAVLDSASEGTRRSRRI